MVTGAMSALVVLLGGCAGSGGEADLGDAVEPDRASQGPTVSPAAALEASSPRGKYGGKYVLQSSNMPGVKDGTRSTSTFTFSSAECSETACSGTVKAPGKGAYSWDGSELVMTFDEIATKTTCVDDAGAEVSGSTYRSRTEHSAVVTAAGGGDSAPARLVGSYRQATVLSDFRNGCRRDGPPRQQAKFSLVLVRK